MSAGVASAGLHVRAGNAMARTRDGLLDGAIGCLEREGVRGTTMAGIAVRSGVAKATLYNHFRTKPDLLAALVAREVDRVADSAEAAWRQGTLADALDRAAGELAVLPAARRAALADPAALLPLLAPADGPGWQHARGRVASVLGTDADPALVDLVLRWLSGQLIAPQPADLRADTARLLASASASASAAAAGAASPAPAAATAGSAGTTR